MSSWTDRCSCVSQRWIFTIMTFMALCIGNAVRSVLSIAITDMVVPIVTNHTHGSCYNSTVVQQTQSSLSFNYKRYNWNEYIQGWILSSFYFGYAPAQFIYGSLAERFGGKYFFGQAIFIPSLLTLLTPKVIDLGGHTAFIVLRVLMGISSSAMYPSVSAMIPHWTTPENRTRFGTFICAGFILGPVIGTVFPALIISRFGWPAAFQVFGLIGMSWFPFWVLLCYNNTEDHPFLTEFERNYLEGSSEKQVIKKPPPAPWNHILKSKQFWAFVIGLFGCDWAYFTMASDLPKYMSSVVGLPIEENGYLSSIPYLCMWVNSMLSSKFVDVVTKKNLMTTTNVKKFLTILTAIGSSAFILLASFFECNQVAVVASFVASVTLMGSAYPSIMMNNLDLSPNYAGSLMSVANGVAALGGVFAPYLVGLLLSTEPTINEWRNVFWIGFSIAVVSSCFVLLYSSSDVQYWNDPDLERDANKITTRRTKKKNNENE